MPKKPTKNTITESDKIKLVNAVANLPFVHRKPKSHDFMRDLMLTVLDFHMRAEVVGKAINYFRDRVQPVHLIYSHDDLTQLLAAYPDTREGNTEASLFLWNNRHWQRTHLLRGLLTYFVSIDVTDQPLLHAWARAASFENDFRGKVRGLGLAVFQWLLIRCGVPTIKPDVWVINFAQRVTGKRVADKVLVDLFNEIAPLVGESMTTIDMTIWAFERMGLSTNDLPGLRVVWWMHAMKLLDALVSEVCEGNWKVSLDDIDRLRYDHSGIRIFGMMRWTSDEEPVETLVTLMQTGWRERFRVILSVHRELASERTIAPIKERLEASGWVIKASRRFQADFDMEVELMMPMTVSVDSVLELSAEVVKRIAKVAQTLSSAFVADRSETNPLR